MKTTLLIVSLVLGAASVQAQAISSTKVCDKANTDNRLNGMSIDQCRCMAQIAQQNLSPELYVLWTEALYSGESRMKEMESLKQSQRKTHSQLKKTVLLSKKKCGLS
ncbi:hypothetical protein [uncultured Ruegeria sp.]|uniref:hypothetical protein n=1 Tax=uncultured Ruegeria sp. TaxID=259304 RepID=UPI00262D3389|nr:hypothetical protein [uncultured Ruegeria sp.]